MSNEIKNVTLSFCCDKDWQTMRTVDEQKRFCASCKHNVIDFTKANNDQLREALQTSSRVCGRFKRSQMSDTFLKYAASVVLASSVSISCSPVEEPLQPPEAPVIEEPIDFGEELQLMGVLATEPDSLNKEHYAPYFDIEPDSADQGS